MIEMVIFAVKAREIGGQGVDEVLPVTSRGALFEKIDIVVEAGEFERPDDL